MKPLAYTLLTISIAMAVYCTLVKPGTDSFWYMDLMFGLATLGGILHCLARKRDQNGE